MIYFVDEDSHLLGALIAELRLRGHAVELLLTAQAARRKLSRASLDAVDLAVIDVMLAPGDLADDSDDDVLTAGIDLLRDLSTHNPTVFPHRAVLFTGSIGEPLRAASACARELDVEVWQKSAFFSPVEFGDRIEHLIERRGES